MNSILSIKNLNVHYGTLQALWNVSIEIFPGEKVAIIGANGSGKTTLLKAVCGLLTASSGSVFLKDKDISKMKPYKIAAKRIAMVPEGRKIFSSLTVEENLTIGYRTKFTQGKHWDLTEVYALFPILKEFRAKLGTSLSGGQQQMLAIGRALMSNPEVIIFDELSLGLAPVIIKDIYEKLEQIREDGLTIILVEQNVKQSLKFADRVYCMLKGQINLSERADEVDYETIQKAYFGI